MSQRVFSGIQPTGTLHLGNYLGAIQNYVELQERFESIYCVVDDHALTSHPDPAELRANTRAAVRVLLACGLDPSRCILFVQSHVPAHTELAWILSCVTAYGDLTRMTQFKDKGEAAASKGEVVSAGLFGYPVLQAADILLYRAAIVPVGEDQVQHLELARDIARRFNAIYGETFVEPQPLLSPAKRVMGLDGETKMSKSRGNDVGLLDPPSVVKEKLRPAKTDVKRVRRTDPGEPNDCNIFSLHRFVTDAASRARIEVGCRSASMGCVECKGILADSIESIARPIRERAEALDAEPGRIDSVIEDGGRRARRLADETMDLVRTRVGLR